MRSLLFFSFLLLSGLAHAYVPFLENNYTWHSTEGGWVPQQYKYFLSGDSVFEGQTYQVMTSELIDVPGQTVFEVLVREDIEEQRVYARWDDIETLLYDFDMTVGETVEIAVQGCPVEMTCTGVGTIPILSGGQRNAWYFDFGFGGEIWIEGIGSNNGPIAPGAYICTADWDPILNCFYENNQLRYDNPDDSNSCGLTGIEDLYDQINWDVLITQGTVRITPKDHSPFQMHVYNSLGQTVFQKNAWGITEWNASVHTGSILFITLESPYRKETYKLLIQ